MFNWHVSACLLPIPIVIRPGLFDDFTDLCRSYIIIKWRYCLYFYVMVTYIALHLNETFMITGWIVLLFKKTTEKIRDDNPAPSYQYWLPVGWTSASTVSVRIKYQINEKTIANNNNLNQVRGSCVLRSLRASESVILLQAAVVKAAKTLYRLRINTS